MAQQPILKTTKAEFNKIISTATNVNVRTVEIIMNAYQQELIRQLRQGKKIYTDFGIFSKRLQPPRNSMNPKTRVAFTTQPKYKIKYDPATIMILGIN